MKMLGVIAGLCVVFSYTTAQTFDSHLRNVEGSYAAQNGEPDRSNNGNPYLPDRRYKGKLPHIAGDAGFDSHFRNIEDNLSSVANRLQNSYGCNQGSYVVQSGTPGRSNNGNSNVPEANENYGTYGAQNVPGLGSPTYRADGNSKNCNVQAWNEEFERIEGRLGSSNSNSHPNPTVRCQQETVVRGKDFGNGIVHQTSSTIGSGSYRSSTHRSSGDPGAEQLAQKFGTF